MNNVNRIYLIVNFYKFNRKNQEHNVHLALNLSLVIFQQGR
jgi:hypothetical protein